MRQLLWLGLGSGLGGCLRYFLDLVALNVGLAAFPVSTFLINVSGSLLIGYLAGLWAVAVPCRLNPAGGIFGSQASVVATPLFRPLVGKSLIWFARARAQWQAPMPQAALPLAY
jgi:hypothetical protein